MASQSVGESRIQEVLFLMKAILLCIQRQEKVHGSLGISHQNVFIELLRMSQEEFGLPIKELSHCLVIVPS
ncbi:hypothetical protein Patl1_35808 [Pistacia atlantica]|nr:hypothetical protein Patl1_35808 [Pistacia atlantica]